MRNSTTPAYAMSATTVLWSARMLTLAILCLWGFFMVAHVLGDAEGSSHALNMNDYASLVLMVASVVGLGLALKWERLGATMAIAAVAVGAVFNWRVLVFPPALIPIAAVLFLFYAYLRNAAQQTAAAGRKPACSSFDRFSVQVATFRQKRLTWSSRCLQRSRRFFNTIRKRLRSHGCHAQFIHVVA